MIRGKQILVVEDEYLLADDMRKALEGAGAGVVGPVPDAGRALALIEGDERIDGALLDINLNGTPAFPVADALIARNIPLAFATGYDRSVIPDRFADVKRLEKPVHARDLIAVLDPLMT